MISPLEMPDALAAGMFQLTLSAPLAPTFTGVDEVEPGMPCGTGLYGEKLPLTIVPYTTLTWYVPPMFIGTLNVPYGAIVDG